MTELVGSIRTEPHLSERPFGFTALTEAAVYTAQLLMLEEGGHAALLRTAETFLRVGDQDHTRVCVSIVTQKLLSGANKD